MNLRAVLRSPFGEPVVRDVVAGRWSEPAGDAAEVIGEGLWALPGLVDAHAHLAAESLVAPGAGDYEGAVVRARESLAAGVTLIVDKGWTDSTVLDVIANVAEEERPEIEAAARVIAAPDGYYPDFGLRAEPDQLEQTVLSEAEAGMGWVKLIGDWPRKGVGPVANFDESALRLAVAAAESMGARVAIHTMAPDAPSMAVAAGVHSIEHGLFLTDEDIVSLGARRGIWVPTLLRAQEVIDQLGPESSGGRLLRQGLGRLPGLLSTAIDAGVRVLAGTDLVGSPADVGAEVIRLAEFGLSRAQALAAASISGFVATDRPAAFEVGASADAVFFAEDPGENLKVLAHPTLVVRMGRLV